MPKVTHLYLPVCSVADIYYPDAFSVELKLLAEKVKPLVEIAQQLNKSAKGFRHIEFDWSGGDWLIINEETADTNAFQPKNPLETDWATDYNDDSDLAPVETVSVRTNGHYVEFRCYEADTGLYSRTEPIYLRGDQVVFRNLAYNLLTGEVTEVDDVQ